MFGRHAYLYAILALVILVFLAALPIANGTSNSQGVIEILSISGTSFVGNPGTDFTGSFQVRNNHANQSLLVTMSESGFGGLDIDFDPATRSIGPGQTDTINFEILTDPDSGLGIFTGQIYAQYNSSNRDYFDAQVNLTASSSGGMLEIDSVVVDNEMMSENETLEGFRPLQTMDIHAVVKSLFDESDDPVIEDIYVSIVIQDIDDRGTDDIDIDAVEFDLDPHESKSLDEFEIVLPKDVENNKVYTMVITAEGKDEEGVTHKAEFRGAIRTEREADDIRLTRFEITPENITCDRELSIDIEVTNLGVGEEDEAAYTIKSTELDMFFRELLELKADPGRRDSEFSKIHTFTVSDNTAPGKYPIIVKTFSDSTTEQSSEKYYLSVYECEEKKTEPKPVTTPIAPKPAEEKKQAEPEMQGQEEPDDEQNQPSSTVGENGEIESVDAGSPLQNKKIIVLIIAGIAIVALSLLYLAYALIF